MSVRQNILTNIKTTLQNITQLKSIQINRASPVVLQREPFPAAFINSDTESEAETQTMEHEVWNWTVEVQVWSRDDDPEIYLDLVHREMAKDVTRGGNALDTKRTGANILDVSPDDRIVAVSMDFLIKYRHKFGLS